MISFRKYLEDIFESKASPTTDDAIYYKIGLHKALWKNKEQLGFDPERASRSTIIKWAKEKLPPFLDDKQEIIHRKDWDLDSLIGETEYQLMHPHYYTVLEWILKNHKRKHDTLTIYECSNSKPYSMNQLRKTRFLDKYDAFTDAACISNHGIVPMEYSHFYPFRYDEWNHFAELPDISKKYTWLCAARFLMHMKHFGYKHVITVFQTPYPQTWAQWLYDNDVEGAKKWLHIVNTPAFDKKMLNKYLPKFNNSKGLVHQRLFVMPEFRDRYERLLKETLSEKDKKEFEKLLKILHDDDMSSNKKKEAILNFNKEHGWEDYNIAIGTDDEYRLVTPDTATSESKVKKYESYVKKNVINGIDERLKEALDDGLYHTHRVIFTPLDILMEYNNDEILNNPDMEYWSMWSAVKNLQEEGNYKALNTYCYAYSPLIKEIGIDEVKKYTNKLGLTQFNDERRVKPDK